MLNSIPQRPGTARWYKEACLAVDDGVDDASDTRGDDRLPGRHRLDDRVWECLAQRAEDGNIEEMMKIRLVRPEAGEVYHIGEAELPDESRQRLARLAVADENEPE